MAGWFTNPDPEHGRPVVELWVHDDDQGQAVFVVGEKRDGQRFWGSFWQPTLPEGEQLMFVLLLIGCGLVALPVAVLVGDHVADPAREEPVADVSERGAA